MAENYFFNGETRDVSSNKQNCIFLLLFLFLVNWVYFCFTFSTKSEGLFSTKQTETNKPTAPLSGKGGGVEPLAAASAKMFPLKC